MRRITPAAIGFGLLTAIAMLGAPSLASAPFEATPVQMAEGEAIDGKALFMKKCKKCHGTTGLGDTKIGKKFNVEVIGKTMSKAKIVKVMNTGVKDTKMKSFKKKLSAEEIDAVADFVRTLPGK